MQASQHYDASYFAWQRSIGEFGGWANSVKFAPYIKPTDTVLDFGCGGGYLLANLPCAKRIGVEINPAAREIAKQNGVDAYGSTSDVPPTVADKIVSNHALEHAHNPFQELVALRNRLKDGGLAIFVVPCEGIGGAYVPNDINNHLYTWNPMTLGNLFTEAGFKVIHAKALIHRWPPMYRTIARLGGRSGFELASRIYGQFSRSLTQVHLVAEKP